MAENEPIFAAKAYYDASQEIAVQMVFTAKPQEVVSILSVLMRAAVVEMTNTARVDSLQERAASAATLLLGVHQSAVCGLIDVLMQDRTNEECIEIVRGIDAAFSGGLDSWKSFLMHHVQPTTKEQ